MSAFRLRAWGVWALLVTGSAVAQAQVPGDTTQHGAIPAAFGVISTHATAHRRLPNTVSDVSASIEVHGRDMPDTTGLVAKRTQSLLDYLRGQSTERLITDQVSFEPELQQLRGQPDRIKGYTGRATVSFRTTADRLPALLAGCLDNGATGLMQSGSSPRDGEVEAARRELAADAARTALAQATAIAGAVGQRVIGIHQIDVDPMTGRPGFPMQAEAMASRAARPSVPIAAEAGETRISAMVSLKVRVGPQN